jgi:hypothetical protein
MKLRFAALIAFLIVTAMILVLNRKVGIAGEGLVEAPDTANLPKPLKDRLAVMAGRPNSYDPLRVFAEADTPSQLFQYYLLDTNKFEPNVFTTIIPDINSGVIPTAANAANHQLPTIGAVRVVLEPKPGLPTDPKDIEAFIDIFTDISGLFVINNESGWYEGWMIHDLRVPKVDSARSDGHAQFGKILESDRAALKAIGSGHNIPGAIFTTDGNAVRFPKSSDRFPDDQSNVVPLQLSMGAYNCLQQSDCHSYWEFNKYTNWVPPSYEEPFTGGLPGTFPSQQYRISSLIAGDGPGGKPANSRNEFGDDPNNPRDPDRLQESSPDDPDRPQEPNEEHAEERVRFIPSGLGNEILLDVYVRIASFEPGVKDFNKRLFDAYQAEVARIDENDDGVIEVEEAESEEESDGLSNERLYIPATKFNRFAVTREINDGFLSPRFAPNQRAWVLSGFLKKVDPPVAASIPRDADNR